MAQFVAADFRQNVRPSLARRQSVVTSPTESFNYLGAPAYAMLGYGGMSQGPLRSKAFSMQMYEPACQSEEKRNPLQPLSLLGSPQI
jgi:hypothetical protein